MAHAAGVPVIVDAAGLTYPLDNLRRFTRLGADLVCYAGKYFDAPQSTGLLVGRRDLVEMAAINSFVGFETQRLPHHRPPDEGRPAGDRRLRRGAARMAGAWTTKRASPSTPSASTSSCGAVKGLPGVEAYRISERETPTPMLRDGVRLKLESPQRAAAVVQALRDGDPCIWARTRLRTGNRPANAADGYQRSRSLTCKTATWS